MLCCKLEPSKNSLSSWNNCSIGTNDLFWCCYFDDKFPFFTHLAFLKNVCAEKQTNFICCWHSTTIFQPFLWLNKYNLPIHFGDLLLCINPKHFPNPKYTECMLHPPLGNQVWSFVSPKGALTSMNPSRSMDLLDKPFSRQIDLCYGTA